MIDIAAKAVVDDFGRGASERKSPPPLPISLEQTERSRERLLAAGFACLGFLVFGIAAVLDPYDAAGIPLSHGTHQQLGLPPCAFKALTGTGCPSCGMTTSVSLLMHADLVAAWRTNWAGCVVAALGVAATSWFLAVAAGLSPGRITADEVVKAMVVVGVTVAGVRWLGVLAAMQIPWISGR
jgi:hypothetical protein